MTEKAQFGQPPANKNATSASSKQHTRCRAVRTLQVERQKSRAQKEQQAASELNNHKRGFAVNWNMPNPLQQFWGILYVQEHHQGRNNLEASERAPHSDVMDPLR